MTSMTALALAAAAATPALGLADLDALDRQVAQFTGTVIGAPGGAVRPLDRRLRLRACHSQITLEWHTQRRYTVTLRCGDAGGWTLFVPVMAAQIPATPPSGGPGALAVSRGDTVSLAITGRGFAVSRAAEALEAGAVGDWIRVRPVTERRHAEQPVRARVVRSGVVSLPAS